MGKRLYVGGLPYSTTEAELEQLFLPLGSIESLRLIIDRDTGRSKGFGFVELSTEADAREAVDRLDGTILHGRRLIVSEAKPQESRSGEGRGGYGGNGGYGGGGYSGPDIGGRGGYGGSGRGGYDGGRRA